VVTGVNNAISFHTDATIPEEQYILDTCNFSGGGDFIDGVQSDDDKANFSHNSGITNSRTIGHYYITGNTTDTVITDNDYTKILGTTTTGILTERFTQNGDDNKMQYTGSDESVFKITVTMSAEVEEKKEKDFTVGIGIDTVVQVDTQSNFTTNGEGRSSAVSSQAIVSVAPQKYVEVYIANITDNTDILVTDLSVIITKIDN